MNTTIAVGYDRALPGERALGVAARAASRRGGSLVVIPASGVAAPRRLPVAVVPLG